MRVGEKWSRSTNSLPGIRRKGKSTPEGYVWVLSQNVPFYHARVLGCPRSRCHENGRIFSPRERRARVCVKWWKRRMIPRNPCLAWRVAQVFDAINLDHKHRFTATTRVLREFLRWEKLLGATTLRATIEHSARAPFAPKLNGL